MIVLIRSLCGVVDVFSLIHLGPASGLCFHFLCPIWYVLPTPTLLPSYCAKHCTFRPPGFEAADRSRRLVRTTDTQNPRCFLSRWGWLMSSRPCSVQQTVAPHYGDWVIVADQHNFYYFYYFVSCDALASVTQTPWGGSTCQPVNPSRRSYAAEWQPVKRYCYY